MTSVREIERIIRHYLRTGLAVVVLIVAPGADVEALLADDPRADEMIVVEPEPSGDAAPETGPSGDPTEPEQEASTAADRYGWGAPDRVDEFDDPLLPGWAPYTGTGHGGHGTRSPAALAVHDGILTIAGDSTGTTGGMAWSGGQRYGRWEARVRAPASDPSYDAVLLLWPDDDAAAGGEIDFAEMQDPDRQVVGAHLHHGPDDRLVSGEVRIDATRWRHWALEWSPEAIVTYVDGREWFRTTDVTTFPPGPMHLCVQLDWFPQPDAAIPQESSMEIDWVRQWSLPASDEATAPPPGDGSGPA